MYNLKIKNIYILPALAKIACLFFITLFYSNNAMTQEDDSPLQIVITGGKIQPMPIAVPFFALEGEMNEEIKKLAPAIASKFGRLDVLVANAALLGQMTPVANIEPKTWNEILTVNLTANWLLIQALEPLLLASNAGRAIFLTSGVSGGRGFWGAYAVTKTALEALAHTWAQEMEQSKLCINIVDPGAVRTAMRALANPGEDPTTLKRPEEITDILSFTLWNMGIKTLQKSRE